MKVFCFALDREATPFLRRFSFREKMREAPCSTWKVERETDSFIILITGVGAEATQKAIGWVARKEPEHILFAGFAGALSPTLKVGDVIQFGEVVDAVGEPGRVSVRSDFPPGADATRLALQEPPGADATRLAMRLLTMPRLIGDPQEKQHLFQEFQADAVDMESFTGVRIAQDRGIPVSVIRVISDGAETRLSPRLVSLLSGGSPSLTKILKNLLLAPWLLPQMIRLAKNTKFAAQQLADVLDSHLE